MRPYNKAIKADGRRRMSPPNRQSMAEIAQELDNRVIKLYKWSRVLRLQGEVRWFGSPGQPPSLTSEADHRLCPGAPTDAQAAHPQPGIQGQGRHGGDRWPQDDPGDRR